MKKHAAGFSLIELIVLIVVLGLAIGGVFLTLQTALDSTTSINPQNVTTQIASSRMELILGQKRIQGFSSFTDPCSSGSPPAACTLPAALSGYAVSSSITGYTVGSDSNYKRIVVTASGPNSAQAVMTMIVGSP